MQLVEQHGESTLWAAVKDVVDDEDQASVILSTAHKAKGREWDGVRLANDFVSTRQMSVKESEAEVRLFYVAMTRAKKLLSVDRALLAHFTTDEWKKPREKHSAASHAPERHAVTTPPRRGSGPAAPVKQKPEAAHPSPSRTPVAAALAVKPKERVSFWKRLFGG